MSSAAASSGSQNKLPSVSSWGYTTLLGSTPLVTECLVLDVLDKHLIIAAPASTGTRSDGSWASVTTAEQGCYKVKSGHLIVLHSIAIASFTSERPVDVPVTTFSKEHSDLPLPLAPDVLRVYYGQEQKELKSTDSEAPVKVLPKPAAPAQPRAKGPVAPRARAKTVLDSSEDEDEEDYDCSDGGEDSQDGAPNSMQAMFKQAQKVLGKSAKATGVTAPLDDPKADPGAGAEMGDPQMMQFMMMMQMMMKIVDKKGSSADDLPEGLDGLRVLRTLSRLRALKTRFRKQPKRVVREYYKHWEEQLDADGKPWNWRDVAKSISWHQFKSMHRVFLMMGEALRLHSAGQHDQCGAQLVQNMKAIHQFASDGSWRVAWQLSFMADPFDPHRQGGSEMELEAILANLKTQDDLSTKTGAGGVTKPDKDNKKGKGGKGDGKNEEGDGY